MWISWITALWHNKGLNGIPRCQSIRWSVINLAQRSLHSWMDWTIVLADSGYFCAHLPTKELQQAKRHRTYRYVSLWTRVCDSLITNLQKTEGCIVKVRLCFQTLANTHTKSLAIGRGGTDSLGTILRIRTSHFDQSEKDFKTRQKMVPKSARKRQMAKS